MLSVRFALLALVPFALLACASGDITDEPMTETTEAIGTYNPLIGTFESKDEASGELSRLVLKTNATFHAEMFDKCAVAPCRMLEEDGRYELFQVAGRNFITLYTREQPQAARYEYIVRDEGMFVQEVNDDWAATIGTSWRFLMRAGRAWCALPTDCTLQNLPIGPCAGQYVCQVDGCNWNCGAPAEEASLLRPGTVGECG